MSPYAASPYAPAMRRALEQARLAPEHGDVPVGAVVLSPDGGVLACAHNDREGSTDPTAHAEVLAVRAAAAALGSWRLSGCTLVVTLEPCAMCAMAIVHARVARLVYAATDPKTGACGSVFDLIGDARHNHRVEIHGGVLAKDASTRLTNYFRAKRGKPPLLLE